MKSYKGLLFVKHESVGAKNEGPGYFLQTYDKDYHVEKKGLPWEHDGGLDKFVGKMVEVQAELSDGTVEEPGTPIRVPSLTQSKVALLPDAHIPRA